MKILYVWHSFVYQKIQNSSLDSTDDTEQFNFTWLYLYDAHYWSSRRRLLTALPVARSSGVWFHLFFNVMSAPLSTNRRATSRELLNAAQCKGVSPLLVCLFTSAPARSNCLATSFRLYLAARWRAVQPYSLLTSTGTLFCSNLSTVRTSPTNAA